MTYATLEKKLSSIPSDYLDEVSNYLDFILFRISEDKPAETNTKAHYRTPGGVEGGVWMSDDSLKPRRALGGMEEGFWMADDFDAPLDDFKEYM